YAGQNDFQSTVKGIHITTLSDSDPMLLTINFASSTTLMKAYYSLSQDGTQGHDTVNFIVGCASNNSTYIHFCHFAHTYGASPIAALFNGSTDSLDGSTKLYLEPMGGTYIYLNIDKYIKTFHQQHPNAVINYAELLLPTADDADTLYPELISAYKRYSNGYVMAISDNNYLVSPYSYTGYDGTYHPEYKSYRLRISQYMQELLRNNADHGMMLYINGRRSSGQRTIINGPLSSRPLRIAFIYSE
ncbi:MAG: hypothetical protein IJ764_02915, partial [Bacteroidales bacterium]|nr:hypothetical protein [Bacteroidales bacterium]